MSAHARVPLGLTAAFVLVWCTGYIAGPLAIEAAGPFTALLWRFTVAALLAFGYAWWRVGWPSSWRGARQAAVVGVVLNAAQFSLMYVALRPGDATHDRGAPALALARRDRPLGSGLLR